MSHRKLNDVGYKKIYPMSLNEDDSFCHYCGRRATINMRLEWDHVPALNVKIPIGCENIKKTLVRSCRECNAMASDTPHLDYLERHFWLKSAYLRKYKKLLLSEGSSDIDIAEITGYLLASIKNQKVFYEHLLHGLGFGIANIEDIDSPVLKLRTKTGSTIENLILSYLLPRPHEDDDSESDDLCEDETVKDKGKSSNNYKEYVYCYESFLDFILEEELALKLSSRLKYHLWFKSNFTYAREMGAPENPELHYMKTWDEIDYDLRVLSNDIRVLEILKRNLTKSLKNTPTYLNRKKFIIFICDAEFDSLNDYLQFRKKEVVSGYLAYLHSEPLHFYGFKHFDDIFFCHV